VNQEGHKVTAITGNPEEGMKEQLHQKGEEDFHHQYYMPPSKPVYYQNFYLVS